MWRKLLGLCGSSFMSRWAWVGIAMMLPAFSAAMATPVSSQTTLAVSPSGTQPTKTVFTMTATVVTAGSTPVTMGTVYFYDTPGTYAAPSGIGAPQPHLLGKAQMRSTGTAVFKTVLPSTTHTLQAVYMPTPQALGSTSATVSVTVGGGGNEVVAVVATAGGARNAYTVQSQLQYQGLIAPTGTLTITDNTTSTVLATTTHITDQGAPSFGAGFALATAANASGTTSLADMDGDGILDLVVVSGSTVSVLHGVGNGTFNNRHDFTVPSGSSNFIDTGDVNNDGYPDVVISDTSNSTVNVLLNDGSGGLLSGSMFPVTSPTKILLGDFGSGYLDIATLQQNLTSSPSAVPTGVNILTNNGTGAYGAATLLNVASAVQGANATDFTVGDFNGDGHLDIMSIENGIIGQSSAYSVFFSDGTGGFQAGSGTGDSVHFAGIVAADANDDGITDAVSTNPFISSGFLMQSDGNGAFQNLTEPSGPFNGGVGAGDFNGDGRTDLLFTASSGFYLEYDNRAIGTRYSPDYLQAGPTTSPSLGNISTGYILGDGLTDFLFGGNPPATWLSYLDVNPLYPAPSTSQTTIGLLTTTSLAPHNITVTYTPNSGGSYGAATSNTIQFTPWATSRHS